MVSNTYRLGGRRCSAENTRETWWSRSVLSRFGHAAILLSLVGCAKGIEPLWFTFSGSEETYEKAVAAADEWAAVCGADVFVTRDPGGVPMHEVAIASGLRGETQGTTVTNDDGEVLLVEIGATGADIDGAIRHEIGHALGVKHRASGVMAAPHEPGARVTPADCPSR